MKVSLPPELAQFVRTKVETGRYGSSSEVVHAVLRLMESRDLQEAQKIEALRQVWSEGVASGDAGPIDLDELKAEARTRPSKRGD